MSQPIAPFVLLLAMITISWTGVSARIPRGEPPQPFQQHLNPQTTMPQCSLPLSESCAAKCQSEGKYNKGIIDNHKFCRCYNENDVFFYVDQKRKEPYESYESFCNTAISNVKCEDKCELEKWPTGYCHQIGVCQCRNKSRDGVYYLKDFCY